jgi:Flp pilus assembly pilin Flp
MGTRSTLLPGRLGGDERGTSVVELGLLLPLLTLLIVNIVDLSMGVSRRLEIHQAVHRTMEFAAAADRFPFDVTTGEYDYSVLKAHAAEAAGVEEEAVDLDWWLECDGIEQDEYYILCAEDEPMARYLQIRIEAAYTPVFSISVAGLAGDQINMSAESAVRIQ